MLLFRTRQKWEEKGKQLDEANTVCYWSSGFITGLVHIHIWSRSIVLEDIVLEAQWAHVDKNYSIIIAANILCFNNPYSDFLKWYIHVQIMQKAASQFLKPLAFQTIFLVFFKKINK